MEQLTRHLCEMLYESVAEESAWPAFFEDFAAAVGADAGVSLFVHNYNSQSNFFVFAHRIPAELLTVYSRDYIDRDLLLPALADSPVGSVHTTESLIPTSLLLNSAIYNDLMIPYGIRYHMGSVLLRENNIASMIYFLRSPKQKPFGDSELRLLDQLVPHLQRAARLHRRVIIAEQERFTIERFLDRVPAGAVLLDSNGRVVTVNASAEAMLASRDGLTVEDGELTAASLQENRRLHLFLKAASRPGSGLPGDSGGALAVSRPSGRHPYVVIISPLPAPQVLRAHRRVAIGVYITDPDLVPSSGGEALRGLFGLSRAEVRLALLLVEGKSLTEASGILGISRNTVRNQLQSLFAKTNTSRQSDLVRVLIFSPAIQPRVE